MENYYQDVLNQIRQAIGSGSLEDADYLIRQECAMPYIPQEVEAELRLLKRDLAYAKSERRGTDTEQSLETLLHQLKGKPQSQLAAASALAERNLRVCLDAVKDYLAKDPQPEAAALLIDAIAEQEIGEEFVYIRNGLEYTFWGDAVTPLAKSEGFIEAMQCLEDWLSREPDMLEMCRTMLIHECYLYLPLSYEAGEGSGIAMEMVRQVSGMMDDGSTFRKVSEQAEQNQGQKN